MMTRMVVCVAIFCFSVAALEQRVKTADGKEVVLKEDGTWVYATQIEKTAENLKTQDVLQKQVDGNQSEVSTTTEDYSVNKKPAEEETPRTALVDVIKGEKGFDVRKAKWGMKKEEVKKSESLQLLSDKDNMLEYKFVLLGISSKIRYKFAENKLAGAEYLIEQDDVNPSRFYADFKALKSFLRKQYGTPISDDMNWTNDIYRAEEKNWGFAISLGFLTCKTLWQNSSTKIVLSQNGANHLINSNIEYSARAGK